MNELSMQQGIQNQVLRQAADAGRSTDTTMAHLTLGEVIIPRELMEDPEVSQTVQALFQAYGVDMRQYTVGDPSNSINPETGYPEFFLKKLFKKVAPIALPILGSLIPGVGTALGAALGGGLGGLVSGGGLKGALSGAALGGLGGYLAGGTGGILGNAAGTTLDVAKGISGLQGPTLGTGIKGALSGGGLSALASGTGASSLTNLARTGASIYSGMQEDEASEEARKALLSATSRAENALNPYAQSGLAAQQQLSDNLAQGFNPGDLSQDQGYQFRLKQGMDALNNSYAAQGLGQSGAALKAAQEYGQGFAQQEYGNAYDRWLQQNSQLSGVAGTGANTAQSLGGIYGDAGNVQANYLQQEAERKNKRIADILAGLGGSGV